MSGVEQVGITSARYKAHQRILAEVWTATSKDRHLTALFRQGMACAR
jgi:hypothetical protein